MKGNPISTFPPCTSFHIGEVISSHIPRLVLIRETTIICVVAQVYDCQKARSVLDWQPQYPSFATFMEIKGQQAKE